MVKNFSGSIAAGHCLANLAPFPDPLSLAPRYQSQYSAEQLQSGLAAFHHLLASIYRAGVESPESLIPPDSSRRQKELKEADLSAYPRLLFALGIYGKLVNHDGQVLLRVDAGDLAGFCGRAKIKNYDPFLVVLEKFGFIYLPTQPLQVGFPANPDLLHALVLFAGACRPLTRKETNPPVEFLRADMRLLQMTRVKIKQVPLDAEEAIRTLSNEKEAAFIRELDAWVKAAGYPAQVRCTGVHTSEFIVTYRKPKNGPTLLGYRTEGGRLRMHLNFNQTMRILPHIAQTSRPFRDLYYERCTCANCGSCENGPLRIHLDGAERRLCGFSYLNLPEVPAEHYETIQILLKAQDDILKSEQVL